MNPAKIVVHEMKRNGMLMVFNLFTLTGPNKIGRIFGKGRIEEGNEGRSEAGSFGV